MGAKFECTDYEVGAKFECADSKGGGGGKICVDAIFENEPAPNP